MKIAQLKNWLFDIICSSIGYYLSWFLQIIPFFVTQHLDKECRETPYIEASIKDARNHRNPIL